MTAAREARARRAAERRRRAEIAAGLGRIDRREVGGAGRARVDPGPVGIAGLTGATSRARCARPRRRS